MATNHLLYYRIVACLLAALSGVPVSAHNGQDTFNPQQQPPYHHQQPTSSVSQDRLNIFDVELLRYTAESANGNFMISPASIKSVLGMILEGAAGSCADQLRTNLRLPDDQARSRDILSRIIRGLNVKTQGITIDNANKIFLSRNYNPRPDYQTILRNFYLSDIESVDYGQPQVVVNTINNWVSRATQGKITKLVEQGNFDADTVMVLSNALYFKGTWAVAFNEKLTSPKCFYVQNDCVRTNMMESQESYNYGFINEINAQAIELPYMGNKFSMLILMPRERNGLTDSFIKDLSYTPFKTILSEMEPTEVQLSMPRLTVDYSEDLVSILQKLGIQEIFGKKADLSGIVQSEQSPQVDSIIHKTRLEVNEQGSVAAAATGAMVIPLIGTTTARMIVDHPFLFFIRDAETGVILFEGRVNRPTEVLQQQQPQQQHQGAGNVQQPQSTYSSQAPNRAIVEPVVPLNIAPTYSQQSQPLPQSVQNYVASSAGRRVQEQVRTNPIYSPYGNVPQQGNYYQAPARTYNTNYEQRTIG